MTKILKMSSPQLHYYDLGSDVVAFSSTRHGGVSTGNYASFNINAYCGDDAANIAANRQALATLLGIPDRHIIMPHQTHSTHVCRIVAPPQSIIEDTDVLMTDVPQLCIGVSTADCIPVLLYDAAHHAVCAVHAGWRGTQQRVVQVAVRAMTEAYGTRPESLRAVIGPGISLDCFEVGDEVYEAFAAAGFDMPTIARKMPFHGQTKWHIDLWACNRQQLIQVGVPDGQIHTAGICTYQHSDDYFSARRLGINSGRIFTAIFSRSEVTACDFTMLTTET